METLKEQRDKKEERKKKPLFANTPTPSVPYPPTHPRTEGVGEVIFFIVNEKLVR
jgi:hypothetical protein